MGKISMIELWVETVLYGVNCAMYALCMLVLLRGGKVPTLRWMLVVTSTILILLATIHVGASLQQLLDAFVYVPPDVPDYSTTYLLEIDITPNELRDYLYNTLVCNACALVYQIHAEGNNGGVRPRFYSTYFMWFFLFKLLAETTVQMILEAAFTGVAYSATAIAIHPNVPGLAISAWVLNITLNVFVTMAIAGRLWWMGRTTASLTSTQTNRFALSIYVVAESGAIFAGADIIALVLYALNSPGFLIGVDIASQLATLTPFLIVVQVGLTGQHRFSRGDYPRTVPTAQDEIMAFRVGIPQDSPQDISLHTTSSNLPSSANGAHVL
ncbi:hypothetical protein HD554DRAFT_2264339 [Boletus coccyginus]|nr:hypothetical protein HD554DRAFT_2264339 [Boletus coccyginus]